MYHSVLQNEVRNVGYSDKYLSQSKLKNHITKWNVEDYHPMIDTGIIKDRKV